MRLFIFALLVAIAMFYTEKLVYSMPHESNIPICDQKLIALKHSNGMDLDSLLIRMTFRNQTIDACRRNWPRWLINKQHNLYLKDWNAAHKILENRK